MINVTGDTVVARIVTEWTKNDGTDYEKDSTEMVKHIDRNSVKTQETLEVGNFGIDGNKA